MFMYLLFTLLYSGFGFSSFPLGSYPFCFCIATSGFKSLQLSSVVRSVHSYLQSFYSKSDRENLEASLEQEYRTSLGSYIHSDVAPSQNPDALDYPMLGPQNVHKLFSHVNIYFIKTGFVPFLSMETVSLLQVIKTTHAVCTIILFACIYEWRVLNRNIQVEINNQSSSQGRKKKRKRKSIGALHSAVFKRSYH